MIHKDKCLELSLPEPASFDNQLTYVLKILSLGFKLNTRIARYIGIHNLHSVASILKKKGYTFTLVHKRVKCPFTGEVPPYPVDELSMTPEQISLLKNKNR
jgi:hypothetical protein